MKFARSLVAVLVTAAISVFTAAVPTSATAQSGGLQPACAVGAPTSSNSAVSFDSSFGSNGVIDMSDSSNNVGPSAGTKTKSGQFLVASASTMTAMPYTSRVRLARYNVDGSLDTTFGTSGIGGIDVPAMQNFGPNFITEQLDGSIMVAGTINSFASTTVSAAVTKFSTNGILDTSFGTNGILTLESASQPNFAAPRQMITFGDSVLVMYTRGSSGSTSTTKIAKISSTGSLDSSFGTSGTLTLSGSEAALAAGSSGTFLVAGSSSAATPDATVSKYTSTGSLDTSFGTSGVATVDTSTSGETGVSAVLVNGKIMVGVNVTTSASGQPGSFSAKLVRLNADGSVDSSFGTGGVATVYSGSMSLRRAEFVPNGTGVLYLFASGATRSFGVAFVSADGTPLANSGATPVNVTSGACAGSAFDVIPAGSSMILVATTYSSASSLRSWIVKASVAGVDLSGGSSATTPGAPTLVTSANQAALVRQPGTQGMVVNGQEVEIETSRVATSAARTPASERTPAQIRALQAAGQALPTSSWRRCPLVRSPM